MGGGTCESPASIYPLAPSGGIGRASQSHPPQDGPESVDRTHVTWNNGTNEEKWVQILQIL